MARVEVVRWVAESKRPFTIIKDCSLLKLLKTGPGRPDYRLPSPLTISQDVKHVFVRVHAQLVEKLKVNLSYFGWS